MLCKHCFLCFIFLCLFSSVSYASGDFSCGAPRGSILFRSYDSCNSVPFLSPGNDSRLNLELLLIDAGKLKGTLATSQDNMPSPESAELVVPFDLNNWQLREPGSTADANADGANSAAGSIDYAQGEGSRCNSAADGKEAFDKAVNTAAGLPKEDASILVAARSALVADCDSTAYPDWKPPQGIRSALGREFASYIAGANAFYAGDFPAALKSFNSLKDSANPWLKETSDYMRGRTLLNGAQHKAFGEWGDLKLENVDRSSLKEADDAFNSYLRDFPHGTYAVSARGLLRRVYWLGGDQMRLAEAFDRAFADSSQGANNVTVLELVQEADSKLLNSVTVDQIQSPQFLAILDLMRMRSVEEAPPGATSRSSFTPDDLEAQKSRFANNPALYKYLLAVFHVYIDDKPDQALALLPSLSAAPLSYFAFSQQTLRVLAMDTSKQPDAERKLLLQMLPLAPLPLQSEQLQLALARLEVHAGHADRIFAHDSPVRDKAIRTIVIEYIASAEMLRQQIKDPKESADILDAARYALLYKELTGGKYEAFQADLALVPSNPSELLAPFVATGGNKDAEYRCPSLQQVAAVLQRDGNDAKSLNCVGELLRIHYIHFHQDDPLPKSDLGGSDSLFPITGYSRMEGYVRVIANRQAPDDARAYALYRAVQCYAPSGNSDCGKQEIPISTRKQWFQMLHKEYAGSHWAELSEYYW